ncbi:MAG: hypothetical protein LBS97_07325 [Treponema sp.]|jgi:hypothetical protein|nr:hypothetical protein [Treponema sp.]
MKKSKLPAPIEITAYTLPSQTERRIHEETAAFLRSLGLEDLADGLSYCVSELLVNAQKANIKRAYFQEKQLRITNAADYRKGMETFKADTMDNIAPYLELQEPAGRYIRFRVIVWHKTLRIEVRNKARLLSQEYRRMHDKLIRAYHYDAEDALERIDNSEGAGLGLTIIGLFLNRLGLSEEQLFIRRRGGETRICLSLPLARLQPHVQQLVSHVVEDGLIEV